MGKVAKPTSSTNSMISQTNLVSPVDSLEIVGKFGETTFTTNSGSPADSLETVEILDKVLQNQRFSPFVPWNLVANVGRVNRFLSASNFNRGNCEK